MTKVERWECATCKCVQLDWDDDVVIKDEQGNRLGAPHVGFCPECGPTIVELKHRCKIPDQREDYDWTCPVCLMRWEIAT